MSSRDYDEWSDAWQDHLDGKDISEYLHRQQLKRYLGL
jgi:hypothetical protein